MYEQLRVVWDFPHVFFDTPVAHALGALLVACFCGGVVGVEREMRGKPAGLRTMMMICCGSTLFSMASAWAVAETTPGFRGDSSRVIAQIVSGIGFLGAGTIIHSDGLVLGLTTASTIWTLAAIGVLVGIGEWSLAIAASMFLFLVLTAFDRAEAMIQRKRARRYRLTVSYERPDRDCLTQLTRVINLFRAKQFKLIGIIQGGRPLRHERVDMELPMSIEFELDYPSGRFQAFLSRLHQLQNVLSIEVSPVDQKSNGSARDEFEDMFRD